MVRAVLCINTFSCSREVVKDLMLIEGVSEVYALIGAYDVIAVVDGENFSVLRLDLIPQIQRVNNVKSTLTLTIT